MEVIERRAAWVAISVAITLAFNPSGAVAFGYGDIGTWELIAYVGGLVCLAAAGVLLVGAPRPNLFVRSPLIGILVSSSSRTQ